MTLPPLANVEIHGTEAVAKVDTAVSLDRAGLGRLTSQELVLERPDGRSVTWGPGPVLLRTPPAFDVVGTYRVRWRQQAQALSVHVVHDDPHPFFEGRSGCRLDAARLAVRLHPAPQNALWQMGSYEPEASLALPWRKAEWILDTAVLAELPELLEIGWPGSCHARAALRRWLGPMLDAPCRIQTLQPMPEGTYLRVMGQTVSEDQCTENRWLKHWLVRAGNQVLDPTLVGCDGGQVYATPEEYARRNKLVGEHGVVRWLDHEVHPAVRRSLEEDDFVLEDGRVLKKAYAFDAFRNGQFQFADRVHGSLGGALVRVRWDDTADARDALRRELAIYSAGRPSIQGTRTRARAASSWVAKVVGINRTVVVNVARPKALFGSSVAASSPEFMDGLLASEANLYAEATRDAPQDP